MSSFACGTCRGTFAEVSELVDHLQTHKNSNETSADQVEKPKTRWTNEQSVALINAYGDMKEEFDGSNPKKNIWDKLAKSLNFGFDATQCYGRWKTMLQDRKAAEDHNRTSGTDRKPYMFENELCRVLGDKRNVHPVHLLESSTVVEQTSSRPLTFGPVAKKPKFSRETLNGEVVSETDVECETKKIHRRVPKKTDMLAWLNEYKKDQIEENKKTREQEERQHKEKMTVMISLVEVLKDMRNSS